MVDPISVAVITAAVSHLANEFSKGLASEAGKTTWKRVAKVLGLAEDDPEPQALPTKIAQTLSARPELMETVAEELRTSDTEAGGVVLYARNVGAIHVHGDQHNTFN